MVGGLAGVRCVGWLIGTFEGLGKRACSLLIFFLKKGLRFACFFGRLAAENRQMFKFKELKV